MCSPFIQQTSSLSSIIIIIIIIMYGYDVVSFLYGLFVQAYY